MDVDTKTCTKCGEEQPVSEFAADYKQPQNTCIIVVVNTKQSYGGK